MNNEPLDYDNRNETITNLKNKINYHKSQLLISLLTAIGTGGPLVYDYLIKNGEMFEKTIKEALSNSTVYSNIDLPQLIENANFGASIAVCSLFFAGIGNYAGEMIGKYKKELRHLS